MWLSGGAAPSHKSVPAGSSSQHEPRGTDSATVAPLAALFTPTHSRPYTAPTITITNPRAVRITATASPINRPRTGGTLYGTRNSIIDKT